MGQPPPSLYVNSDASTGDADLNAAQVLQRLATVANGRVHRSFDLVLGARPITAADRRKYGAPMRGGAQELGRRSAGQSRLQHSAPYWHL